MAILSSASRRAQDSTKPKTNATRGLASAGPGPSPEPAPLAPQDRQLQAAVKYLDTELAKAPPERQAALNAMLDNLDKTIKQIEK